MCSLRRRHVSRVLRLRALACRLALVVGMVLPAPALVDAQPAPAGDVTEYDRVVHDAIEEFSARRFEEARVLFRRAHALTPNARTLRGIGMASFELSDYVDAYLSLTAALAETRRPLTREMREQTESLRDRASSFLGRLVLTLDPPTATVVIDGVAPTIVAGAILANPGTHSVAISAPGHVERIESIRIEGGATLRLELRLSPAHTPPRVVTIGFGVPSRPTAPSPPPPPPVTMPESFRVAFPVDESPDEPIERGPWRYSGGVASLARVVSVGVEGTFDDDGFAPDTNIHASDEYYSLRCDVYCPVRGTRVGIGLELSVRLARHLELAIDLETGLRIASTEVTLARIGGGERSSDASNVAWWVRPALALRLAPGSSRFVLGFGARFAVTLERYGFDTSESGDVSYLYVRETIEGMLELGGRIGTQRDHVVLLRQSYGPSGFSVDLAAVISIERGAR